MNNTASFEALCSTLFYLLSRYARTPQDELRPMIRDHLQRLARHPESDQLRILRKTCERLALHWDGKSGDATTATAGRARRSSRLH